MVEVKPFRGWYFDVEKVRDINCVVCPPHDIISDEERDHLYEKSDFNAVRLILPKDGYDEAAKSLEEFASKAFCPGCSSPLILDGNSVKCRNELCGARIKF